MTPLDELTRLFRAGVEKRAREYREVAAEDGSVWTGNPYLIARRDQLLAQVRDLNHLDLRPVEVLMHACVLMTVAAGELHEKLGMTIDTASLCALDFLQDIAAELVAGAEA